MRGHVAGQKEPQQTPTLDHVALTPAATVSLAETPQSRSQEVCRIPRSRWPHRGFRMFILWDFGSFPAAGSLEPDVTVNRVTSSQCVRAGSPRGSLCSRSQGLSLWSDGPPARAVTVRVTPDHTQALVRLSLWVFRTSLQALVDGSVS